MIEEEKLQKNDDSTSDSHEIGVICSIVVTDKNGQIKNTQIITNR